MSCGGFIKIKYKYEDFKLIFIWMKTSFPKNSTPWTSMLEKVFCHNLCIQEQQSDYVEITEFRIFL